MTAHRLNNDSDVRKRKPTAAETLGHGDAEPAELGNLAPKLPIEPGL